LEKVPINTPLINALRKNIDNTKSVQDLVSKKTRIEEVSMVKLNTRCSSVLQNELPPKEKDPNSFILPLDFVIIDIVEDDKVPIILGRPMLAIAHDSGERKLCLMLIREYLYNLLHLFVQFITSWVLNGFEEQESLKEFLMNDEINGDLGDFLELDDLFPENDVEPFGILSDSENEIGIGLEDFGGNLEDLLDEQALQFRKTKVDHPPL
ncbi:hypothetical protein Tco_1100913, partial [Tanacetum coccineum]